MDFQLPPPKGWEQFEDLCADLFELEWQDPMLVRHGRAGQQQHGVDIIGRSGATWPVGVQCKRKSIWPVRDVTKAELDQEVEKAKTFRPALKAFYLVSTAPNDQALQEHAAHITQSHSSSGLFPVVVFGWDELERRAKRHPSVAARHFGAFARGAATPLLASWRAEAGKLVMTESELAVSIRELIHDYRAFPSGRVAFTQKEAEALQLEIQSLQTSSRGTVEERVAIVDLRDKLKILEDRQVRVREGLTLLLGRDPLRDEVRIVWPDNAATIVRSFIEREIDPEQSTVTGLEKIRLHLPDGPEDYVPVFVPSAIVVSIWDHERKMKERFPKLRTDNVGEVEPSVKFLYAVPAILSYLVSNLTKGLSLDDFERRKWLDVFAWRLTT